MKKKLLTAVMLSALMLSGCSEKKEEGELAYEQPLNTMRLAVNYNDEQSYLNVWLPWEKQRFLSSEEDHTGFLLKSYDREAYDGKLMLRINSAEAMSDTELEELSAQTTEQYGVRPEFSKGMNITAELRVRKNTEVLSDPCEFKLVRLENNWYICGEVVENFSFSAS